MHVLRLAQGNATIVIANTVDYLTTEYTPLPPSASLADMTKVIERGADDGIAITETLEMLVMGGNLNTLQNNIRRLQDWMVAAELYHRHGEGQPVYIELQVSGEGSIWRSQILSGRFEQDAGSMRTVNGLKVEGRLIISRRFFWERSAEIECRLSSVTQPSINMGGRNIRNHADGTFGNYVDIPPGEVYGALPAPARVELRNTNGASRSYSNIYLGCEVLRRSGTHFAGILQGEDAMSGGDGAAATGYSGNSGGAVYGLTLSGIARIKWQWTAAQMAQAAGQTYHIFVRFNWYTFVPGNTIYMTPQINELSGTADLNPYGVEMALPQPQQTLVNVGSVSFGDWETPASMALALYMRSAASVLVEIDFIQPLPAANMRHLQYFGYGLGAEESIVDDGMSGFGYVRTVAGQQLPVVGGWGRPILLWPNTGLAHRLYVMQEQNGQMPINDRFAVRVYYRPRRLTI